MLCENHKPYSKQAHIMQFVNKKLFLLEKLYKPTCICIYIGSKLLINNQSSQVSINNKVVSTKKI